MANKNLAGRYGLYCGACEIYRAYNDGGDYRQRKARFFQCPPEKVRCEGCQILTSERWGNNCKIVQCLNTKGFRFCSECPDYEDHSCEKFEKFSTEYLDDGADLRANLAKIKTGEVEEWLKASEEKFRCPTCGKPLSIGALRKIPTTVAETFSVSDYAVAVAY